MKVLECGNFDISKIGFSDLVEHDGSYEIEITYEEEPFILKTGNLRVGDTDYQNSITGEFEVLTEELYQTVLQIEDMVKLHMHKNMDNWSGNKTDTDSDVLIEKINSIYKTNLLLPKSLTYNPNLKVLMESCDCFDKDNNIIQIYDALSEGNTVSMLIKFNKIKFKPNKVYIPVYGHTLKNGKFQQKSNVNKKTSL